MGISFTLDRFLAHVPSQLVEEDALSEIADKVDVTADNDKIANENAAYRWALYDQEMARRKLRHVQSRVSLSILHVYCRFLNISILRHLQHANPPWDIRIVSVTAIVGMLLFYVAHCTWVTQAAYSSPSIVIQSGQGIIDDYREAYYWLRKNTAEDARVMSWWDYGYQLAGMANRTTLVDNNTWNNTHIAQVGLAMSSDELTAYKVVRR